MPSSDPVPPDGEVSVHVDGETWTARLVTDDVVLTAAGDSRPDALDALCSVVLERALQVDLASGGPRHSTALDAYVRSLTSRQVRAWIWALQPDALTLALLDDQLPAGVVEQLFDDLHAAATWCTVCQRPARDCGCSR